MSTIPGTPHQTPVSLIVLQAGISRVLSIKTDMLGVVSVFQKNFHFPLFSFFCQISLTRCISVKVTIRYFFLVKVKVKPFCIAQIMYVQGGNKARVGNSFVCHFRSICVWEGVLPLLCILTLYIVHIVYIYIYTYIFTYFLPKKTRIIYIYTQFRSFSNKHLSTSVVWLSRFLWKQMPTPQESGSKGGLRRPCWSPFGHQPLNFCCFLVLGLSLHWPALKLTKCPTFSSAEQDKSSYW